MKKGLLVFAVVVLGFAQEKPSVLDSRLTVHTLVREDMFAGYMSGNMDRMARGEKTLDRLLVERPAEKPAILAWQGGGALARAVQAYENNRPDEFERHYKRAVSLLSDSVRTALASADGEMIGGAVATTGGTYLFFGDRLPEKYRADAWSKAYEYYRMLWKAQGPMVDRLPLHLRGELIAGLAQTAARTGRNEEAAQYVDMMLAKLANTPYESRARNWKESPASAATSSVTCQTCHEGGRLAARTAALNK